MKFMWYLVKKTQQSALPILVVSLLCVFASILVIWVCYSISNSRFVIVFLTILFFRESLPMIQSLINFIVETWRDYKAGDNN